MTALAGVAEVAADAPHGLLECSPGAERWVTGKHGCVSYFDDNEDSPALELWAERLNSYVDGQAELIRHLGA